jgi:hypothetical protein
MALVDSSITTTILGDFPTNMVAQRTGTVQQTALIVTSASFGATQAATLLEVANTLIALGYWKGNA